VKLSVVMGLGWVLGFVAAFADWPTLWYVFIVVNSLQGAMLCVAFVATRQVNSVQSCQIIAYFGVFKYCVGICLLLYLKYYIHIKYLNSS